jgi:hypothetical protein
MTGLPTVITIPNIPFQGPGPDIMAFITLLKMRSGRNVEIFGTFDKFSTTAEPVMRALRDGYENRSATGTRASGPTFI